MEPLLLSAGSRHRPELTDVALELAAKSAGFRRSLPDSLLSSLADLVRAMNCYYSNLIEGHDTHPIDIEKALKGDYSRDARKRDFQIEATAHMAVQQWIDSGALPDRPATADSIREIHRRFCARLPEDLLWIDDPESTERIRVIPGELRDRDVRVGRDIPVSAPAVPRFLTRYEEVYSKLGRAETILSTAAAHHRLAWIHPFLDGNGRVARLVSHATMLDALDTGAAWSIARGLARNVDEYKRHLADCDLTRRSDLDGRGHLSEESLADFTRFFLGVCTDQVTFMEGLMQPDQLRARILLWAEESIRLNKLPQKSSAVLEALLSPRAAELRALMPFKPPPDLSGFLLSPMPGLLVKVLCQVGAVAARRVVSALIDQGVITSPSSRAPLRLAFPATLASRWMPGLFPERSA